MSVSEIRMRVRYFETDQMGRAHHAHHLVWCEAGRTAWLRDRGASYAELEEEGLLLPVSRAEIEYRRPVGYDEAVLVRTRLKTLRSRTLTFSYTLLRASDEALLARGETDLVCLDRSGRVRRLPAHLKEVLSEGRTAVDGGSVGEER